MCYLLKRKSEVISILESHSSCICYTKLSLALLVFLLEHLLYSDKFLGNMWPSKINSFKSHQKSMFVGSFSWFSPFICHMFPDSPDCISIPIVSGKILHGKGLCFSSLNSKVSSQVWCACYLKKWKTGQISNVSELIRNAEFQGLPQIYWIRICISSMFPNENWHIELNLQPDIPCYLLDYVRYWWCPYTL